MKKLRIFATAILVMVCALMPVQAQNAAGEEPEYEYTFNPHLFIQAQGGIQYTLGEADFSKLLSPNVQIGLGYEFTPSLAARLSLNAWQSKGGLDKDWVFYNLDKYEWKLTYLAPSIDAMLDLTNLIGGFNPERKIGVGIFAGIGMNVVLNNKEAGEVKDDYTEKATGDAYNDPALSQQTKDNIAARILPYYDKKSLFFPIRFGTNVDWHINDNWTLGLEFNANSIGDEYNSKEDHNHSIGNSDWYFNTLIGVKYCFGPTYDKKPKEKMIPESEAANYAPACDPIEKTDTVVVKEPVEVFKPSLYEEIYYDINKDKISSNEKYKIRRIVEFMNENPEATIEIAGHADKATGTAEYNKKLSQRRADNVAQALKDAGIEESRITVSYHGSEDNIYQGEDMKLNRVSICTAK